MNSITTKFPFGNFIGFDNLANDLQHFAQRGDVSFPKSNVIKTGEHTHLIELALAGYSKDDVKVERNGNMLSIEAESLDDIPGEYVHRGISSRAFTKSFRLSENMQVIGADFVDGMLAIRLEEVVPESEKPQLIKIS